MEIRFCYYMDFQIDKKANQGVTFFSRLSFLENKQIRLSATLLIYLHIIRIK